MNDKISYAEALSGVVSPEDLEGVLGLVEQHKNWGAFRARVPSHLITLLVDEIKRLREAALASAVEFEEIEVEFEDEGGNDDSLPF